MDCSFIAKSGKKTFGLDQFYNGNHNRVEKGLFHFNASFTALNIAKLDAHRQQLSQKPFVFSMASVKRRALNDHLLDTFISRLGLSPTLIKSHPNYQNLRDYGVIAA
ncbi:MAG: hypothetical protein HWQ58_16730 [Nostoc sp. LPT]|uniref:hypothetical protein n=1 Tax=uncultured Nostoc sp. TaxID=340711 RepID=UPI001D4AAE81|nr:hypothetical protein [Nostoc sp. LPT]